MEKQNFGLSKEDFEKLVSDLKNGNEQMFEHIFLSHFGKALSFLMNNLKIEHNKAYDACMDTMIVFRKGLINDKYVYGNLSYLFTRMATQVYLKSRTKEHPLEEARFANIPAEEPIHYLEEELVALEKAWSKLGEKCKGLLRQFYYEKVQLKKLAEQLGQNPATMRKQKERCLNTLRTNLQRYI